ncbi:MAG: asparaginase [Azospirillaceae bacterium]
MPLDSPDSAVSAPDPAAPVLVERLRGGAVESRHRGRAVVADRAGRVIARWGDVDAPCFPRSAVKPILALPLVESGAADAFGFDDADIALACGSHAGQPAHVERVAAILARLGLEPGHLACGGHSPFHGPSAEALIRAGRAPGPLHDNCSGKHAGMLATAVHLGEPVAGYAERTHPVQQRCLGVLEQLTVQDLGDAAWGRDGCAIPTYAVPLGGLAVAMARFADPIELPEPRAAAVERVRHAWGAEPFFVAGDGRIDTVAMAATGGRILTKGGAEGVHAAAVPEAGLGIALKIEDGAGRAAEVALVALLEGLGLLDTAALSALTAFRRPSVRTRNGLEAGALVPAEALSRPQDAP